MIIKRCFLLLFILLITLGSSKAQWQKLSFEGGISKNIVQTDSFLFMLNNHGIYKSAKTEIHWQKINSSTIQNAVAFHTNNVYILSDSNKIYLVYNVSTPYFFESADNGTTWQDISPNKNHLVVGLFRLNGNLHVVARTKLNATGDTTIFYKRINNNWNFVSSFNAALRVQISNDTLYLNNTGVRPNTWYYSVDAINLQAITTNAIWNSLTNVVRVNHKYYGIKENKQFFSSADGITWKNHPELSFFHHINSFLLFENKIYVNFSSGFKNYIYSLDLTTSAFSKVEGLNTVFNAMLRVDSALYISTINGLYRYRQNLQYKMKGINDAHITRMFAIDSILYIESRDTIFRSLNKGQSWQAMNEFSPQLGELKMYKFNNKVYASVKNKLFISTDHGLTFKSHEITFGAPKTIDIIGYDKKAVFIRGNTDVGNIYLRTSNGINYNILLFQVFAMPIYPSAVYEDGDTLFCFGNYANFKYYSLDSGYTWHGYYFLNTVDAQYFVAENSYALGRPFAYCMNSSIQSKPDIAIIRKDRTWHRVPMYEGFYETPIMYESENIVYAFRANRLLEFSLDTFSTLHQYPINFNIQAGYDVNTFAMLGNSVYVSVPGSGIWSQNITKPFLSVQNDFVNSTKMIYPNPTEGLIYLYTEEIKQDILQVEVYDLQGKKHLTIYRDELIKDSMPKLDLSEFPAQMYVIKIITDSDVYTTRCVLKK